MIYLPDIPRARYKISIVKVCSFKTYTQRYRYIYTGSARLICLLNIDSDTALLFFPEVLFDSSLLCLMPCVSPMKLRIGMENFTHQHLFRRDCPCIQKLMDPKNNPIRTEF